MPKREDPWRLGGNGRKCGNAPQALALLSPQCARREHRTIFLGAAICDDMPRYRALGFKV